MPSDYGVTLDEWKQRWIRRRKREWREESGRRRKWQAGDCPKQQLHLIVDRFSLVQVWLFSLNARIQILLWFLKFTSCLLPQAHIHATLSIFQYDATTLPFSSRKSSSWLHWKPGKLPAPSSINYSFPNPSCYLTSTLVTASRKHSMIFPGLDYVFC